MSSAYVVEKNMDEKEENKNKKASVEVSEESEEIIEVRGPVQAIECYAQEQVIDTVSEELSEFEIDDEEERDDPLHVNLLEIEGLMVAKINNNEENTELNLSREENISKESRKGLQLEKQNEHSLQIDDMKSLKLEVQNEISLLDKKKRKKKKKNKKKLRKKKVFRTNKSEFWDVDIIHDRSPTAPSEKYLLNYNFYKRTTQMRRPPEKTAKSYIPEYRSIIKKLQI